MTKIILLLTFYWFLTGCAAPLFSAMYAVAPVLQTLGIIGMAANLHEEITKADFKTTIAAEYSTAWQSSLIAIKNLDIQVKEAKENEKKDGGVVTGSTPKHNIKVVVAKLTERTTQIGTWASGDIEFATLIATEIHIEIQKNLKPSS